jgi:hypothetical protein
MLGPRRGDNANRRLLQTCCYGRKHSDTECFVHVHVTGIGYVEMGFVVLVHGTQHKTTQRRARPSLLTPMDTHRYLANIVCGFGVATPVGPRSCSQIGTAL